MKDETPLRLSGNSSLASLNWTPLYGTVQRPPESRFWAPSPKNGPKYATLLHTKVQGFLICAGRLPLPRVHIWLARTEHACRDGAADKDPYQQFVRTGKENQGSMAKNVRWYSRSGVDPARSGESGSWQQVAALRG